MVAIPVIGNAFDTEVEHVMAFLRIAIIQESCSQFNVFAACSDGSTHIRELVLHKSINGSLARIQGRSRSRYQRVVRIAGLSGGDHHLHTACCAAYGSASLIGGHLGGNLIAVQSSKVTVNEAFVVPLIQGLQISLVVILRSIELNLAVLIQEEVAVVGRSYAIRKGDRIGFFEVRPVKAQRSLSALLFLERSQDGMPLINRSRHFQSQLIQPVLTDEAADSVAQSGFAADERERIVMTLIGFYHLINIRILFQILLQVRAILINNIIQSDDNAIVDSLFRAAGIAVQPLPLHNIRQIAVCNDQVELLVFLSACRMLELDGNTGVLLPYLTKLCISQVGEIGGYVRIQLQPVGKAAALRKRIGNLFRRCGGSFFSCCRTLFCCRCRAFRGSSAFSRVAA